MMKKYVVFLLFLLHTCLFAQNVGIPSSKMRLVYSEQKSSQWCWAASIQMVMNYYGVSINQETIVKRSYGSDPWGNLPNWAGSIQTITANLNGWGFDNRGKKYVVAANLGLGAPTPRVLVQELKKGHPLILGYKSSATSGHAVVCTAVNYRNSAYGPIIDYIIVRDPWPSWQNKQRNGRVIYRGAQLARLMTSYWIIRVVRQKNPPPFGRRCQACRGMGKVTCNMCLGKGFIACKSCYGQGGQRCPSCRGYGQLRCAYGRCAGCNFSGVLICGACRGQKILYCRSCGGKKGKRCFACRGKKRKICRSCHGQGKR